MRCTIERHYAELGDRNALAKAASRCRPTDNDVIELIIHGYCGVYAPCSVPCGLRDDRACRLVSCLRSDAEAENIGTISVDLREETDVVR